MKVTLNSNFYRDGFRKVAGVLAAVVVIMTILTFFSIYLYRNKPSPVTFLVQKEMRVLQPVPLDQAYLSSPDVLQWVTDVFLKVFVLDFNNYNAQLKSYANYFTADGWKAFLNQLNLYANYNNVQAYKLFVTSSPAAAPTIERDGVISGTGKYGWWIRVPVNINYAGYRPPPGIRVSFLVLVLRVSTLNDLTGVAIGNVIPAPLSKRT